MKGNIDNLYSCVTKPPILHCKNDKFTKLKISRLSAQLFCVLTHLHLNLTLP